VWRFTAYHAALSAADASFPQEPVTPEYALRRARHVANVVSTVTPRVLIKVSGASVLWVDDQPDNNVYARQAFEALGINVVLARSTEEALKKIEAQRFVAIISDMGRPPDARAGYTLLDALRASGVHTPFIICAAGGSDANNKAEARRHGAYGSTTHASELFAYVLEAVQLSS
jgi:CheY-like chemotaxis protein